MRLGYLDEPEVQIQSNGEASTERSDINLINQENKTEREIQTIAPRVLI